MCQCCLSSLEREALPPILSGKSPVYFAIRPAIWKMQADPPQEVSGDALLDSPAAEAPKGPVPHQHRYLTPCVVPTEDRSVPEVAHNLRIAAHGRIWFNVGVAKRLQQETRSVYRIHGAGIPRAV